MFLIELFNVLEAIYFITRWLPVLLNPLCLTSELKENSEVNKLFISYKLLISCRLFSSLFSFSFLISAS